MTEIRLPEIPHIPPGRDAVNTIRVYLGGRWGLAVLAAVLLIAGLAFNWSWLVAVGLAPLLLAVLPCAAMCALGLCMNHTMKRPSQSGPDMPKDGQ